MPLSVLGPLEVVGLRPRDRLVLGALAVRRGVAVSGDELADACWGERPPGTWWQQVKTSVAAIRSELGPDAVRTDTRGYALGLDPASLDSVRFEQIVATAREHVVRGEPRRAVTAFRRGLDLWRGEPFDALREWEPARLEAMRLTEIRSAAEEELLDARLATEDAGPAIADAERLVQTEPLREERWALLALAQYRAGRQADALAVLQEARARFVEALGIDPGPRLTGLTAAILRQDPVLDAAPVAASPRADCPYPGLQAFDGAAADRFFGRDAEIDALLDRARPGRVVAVVGPSGSGKSSVLLGGLLPAIAAGARTVRILPLDADVAEAVAALAGLPRRPDVIVIDQFEEFFQFDDDPRARIAADLGRFVDDGGTLLITVRSDFLDRTTALPHVGAHVGGGVFALGPLGRTGLRQAVEQPARVAGLQVEPGLVELILRDAEDRATTLPHLAHALVETWRRRDGATLTVDGYESSGGIAGAIANSAEERYQLLSDDERQSCRSLMMRLLQRDDSVGVVRRRIALAALLADGRRGRVVEQLVAARLLAVDGDELVVVHEAVARAWPRLDDWLDADAESAALLHRVEEGAAAWVADGRPADDLPRGARLEAMVEWRDQAAPELTAAESAYLGAAIDLRRSEVDELAARAAATKRQNRRLRLALGSVAALLVVAIGVGGLAVVRQREATAAETDAKTEALASIATSLVTTDRDAGALLAAELYRRNPTDVRARSALLALLSAPGTPDRKIVFPGEQRIFAAPIPGTDRVVVAADDVTRSKDGLGLGLTVWDMGTGSLVRTLPVRLPDAVSQEYGTMHVGPDGVAVLAYPTWDDPRSCCNTIVASVDVKVGRLVAGPVTVQGELGLGGMFIDGGRTFVTRRQDSVDPVWFDVATLRETGPPKPMPVEEGGNAVAMLEDGSIGVGAGRSIERFDPHTHVHLGRIALQADLARHDIAPLGDGTALVTGDDATARIDLATGRTRWQVPLSEVDCAHILVLVVRGTFICTQSSSWEGRIADGVRTGRTFPMQAEWMTGGEIVDGALVMVNQRTVPFLQRFPIDDSGPISRLIAAGKTATNGGFATARTVVVGDRDSTTETGGQMLWDIGSDRQIGPRSSFIDALGDGAVARTNLSPETEWVESVDGGTQHPLSGGVFDGSLMNFWPGSSPHRAFAVMDDAIQQFDPKTGRVNGPALRFPGKALLTWWVMVHDAPGTGRALVTFWDVDQANLVTATFDLTTGKELARGLSGDVASVLLPDGDTISTTSSELRRSTPELQPVASLPKPVAGANHFEISLDGRTLLLEGAGQPAALYDLGSDTKLGNDIATDSPTWDSAHLSPDGRTLVTNAKDGVLVWTLDAATMAKAACRMAGRKLTATEWRGYFGSEPEIDTCRTL